MNELNGKAIQRVELSPVLYPQNIVFEFTDGSKLTVQWRDTHLQITIGFEQPPKKSSDDDPEYQVRMMTE
ncbi:MAG: hypothetical protein K9M46_04245 [Candidatus Pacebacteria bacterium]|nr:hypothetical protein [Candidatus Paceibacterota bacterium]